MARLMLRFLTAGESHGPALVVIVEGMPAGVPLAASDLAGDLARRQLGYGRGRRMAIEQDRAEIRAGVRRGQTLGSPIALEIRNRDWTNWQHTMSAEAMPDESLPGARRPAVTRPRPGHADLSGGVKYDRQDLRDILERASARETAARVAAGAVARALLRRLDVDIASHVVRIGSAAVADPHTVTFDQARALAEDDDLRCVDDRVADAMRAAIDAAKEAGDTVGGAFEVLAHGVPPGLGSHVQWDRKLDGRLAQAFMSIPAIKAVGIGRGVAVGELPGSRVHDEILSGPDEASGTVPGIRRPTNNAGGLEGGITNGEDVRVTAWMKPISTLMKPLRSVDLATMTDTAAAIERSDVCAVPAAAVVGEAMMALVLANAVLEKFGGDTLAEIDAACRRYAATLRERLIPQPQRA
jgi:chorismate synthase